MNALTRCAPLAAIMLVGAVAVSAARADHKANGPDVIGSFLKHIDSLGLADSVKQQARRAVQDLQADEYSRGSAITAGLSLLYPGYEQAVQASESEDVDSAIKLLRPHIDSDDLFLAADASFLLARSLMNHDRHEDALPILERLSTELSDYTPNLGAVTYFTGLAHANLLENQRALKAFATFLESYPDAPERLRVAAWRQLQTIQAIQEGGMEDIYHRMDFSRRRLDLEKTDDVTQDQQDKIVNMLAKLIRDQEKKECSSSSSKKNSQSQQESQAQKPGESDQQGKSNVGGSSNNPNGVARKVYSDGPSSPWSRLRDRTRDAANSAIKEKLPARYRTVVEKYYEKTSGNDKGDKQDK